MSSGELVPVSSLSAIQKQCPGVPEAFSAMHLRRMPETYAERFAPAEIGRHVRLLSRVNAEQVVEVEVRSLGGQNLEVCVVGYDRTGVLAAITTALASDGLDVQDLQLATYLPAEEAADSESEPTFFVDVVRVASGSRRGVAVADIAKGLRERLSLAFARLAEGDLAAAQTAASSDSQWTPANTKSPRSAQAPVAVKEGLVLEGFRLEQRLAKGGMSEVYLATQISLGRKVAVKVVLGDPVRAGELAARFIRETQVLAGFTSPHIVQVLAAGAAPLANGQSLRWMAMEYMPHGDLTTWVKRNGTPSVEAIVHWFRQALQGLQYAHQRGILHRDIKPQNVLLTGDGDVKLCDFGLLKRTDLDEIGLTQHGCVMGTPQYISPEQALGDDADERSDIYSLGATFFHLLSGRLPFEESKMTALLLRVTRDEAPSLMQITPLAPRPLSVIVARMLANKPVDRYQSVDVILEDLESYVRRGLLAASNKGLPLDRPTRQMPQPEMTQAFTPSQIGPGPTKE